ncbi:ribosomal protein L7/L12 [Cloacibacillus sp. An23]|uniref:ribosomal protein L7/L12 n=1 Tax=Cloacibacillus sp. An23 TaxID=1965591 RepID=UPI000B3AD920|nr:ribosomal protein L7/L12 [Cloacibacillus sp. An23]OUO94756.1 hypothetical protein B5F39_02495 [Cloacibacillus sp. An23]
MADKNVVTAGAYKGAKLVIRGIMSKELRLEEQKLFGAKRFTLNRQTVRKVGIIDTDTTKSASSALLRGGAGVVLLGGVGIAAALSAKNKKTHQVMITFSDNKECVAVVDGDVLTMLQDLILNSQGVDRNFDFYEGRHRNDDEDDYEDDEPVQQPQPSAPSSDLAGQLAQLAALKNAGALTEEEFAKAKARLLDSNSSSASKAPEKIPQHDELFDVILTEHSTDFNERINLIKAMRSVIKLGMREAKEAVDNTPSTIARGVSREKAEQIREAAENNGGEVEIKKA